MGGLFAGAGCTHPVGAGEAVSRRHIAVVGGRRWAAAAGIARSGRGGRQVVVGRSHLVTGGRPAWGLFECELEIVEMNIC